MLPWSAIVIRSDSPFAARFLEELRKTHRDNVVFTPVDRYHRIYLDAPGPDLLARRIREFISDDLRDSDCVFCRSSEGD